MSIDVHNTKSDLIDLVQHEHHHMTRLFADLKSTFQRLADGDLEDSDRQEMVEMAHEDLSVAFEELLEHFDQEEEVFFVELERQFPELSNDIAELVETHEAVCEKTRWLQRMLRQDPSEMAGSLGLVTDVLTGLQQTLNDHTAAENKIMGSALRRMTPAEREELLRKMRDLG